MAKLTLTIEDAPDGGAFVQTSSTNEGCSSDVPLTSAEKVMNLLLIYMLKMFPSIERLDKPQGSRAQA